MNEIYLIRHGKTYGNTLGRYIGSRTDEALLDAGKEELKKFSYPKADKLYVSPMKRCIETAEILFPEQEFLVVDGLKECDFGEFENKNYQELSDHIAYQKWIDSNGSLPFPKGESREEFKRRCCAAFISIVEQEKGKSERIAMVVHGGTIMAILETYGTPKQSYFDYQVKNGEGYRLYSETEHGLWKYENL